MDRYSEMEMTKIARAEFKRGRKLAISEFKEKLKENWRIKARKMEIMSGEVAIFELEDVLEKTAQEITE